MSGQHSFFSWWFGELREVFSGRPVPIHALALSEREIALVEKGVDQPLGVIDAEAHDLVEQVEGLRSRITGRRGRNPIVEVQLPAEQVLFNKFSIAADADPVEAVKRQLQEATGYRPDQLVYDIGPVSRRKGASHGEAVVGIALSSTVDEAVGYARKWGFDPGRVTSIESPRAFRRGPEFQHEGARAGGSVLPKVAAALAVLTLALGGAAAARALSIRADLAEQARAEAAALPEATGDVEERELALAEFAHAAAMASDMRDSTMPVWRILAEIAATLPSDVVLSEIDYKAGQLSLSGTASSIEGLSEAMDRSAIFSAPYFPETRPRGQGSARFVMEVTVDERNIR